MKIVFLCGCLEPGRDGVGDYTRRLAGELIRQGLKVGIVSLNDTYIDDELLISQVSEDIEVPVLRLPSLMLWKTRLKKARQWIDNIKPQWLSLQYVPFSFDSRGLPFGFNKLISDLRKPAFLHIMFHELWVGSGHSIKSSLYAALQKMIIRQMKAALKPELVHTHLPYYYRNLKSLKFNVNALPLFANFSLGKNQIESLADGVFRVGVFSQIHIDNSIIDFLKSLQHRLNKKGIFLEILLIGDNDRLRDFGAFLENSEVFKETVQYTGFLKDTAVSNAIRSCNIGVTSIPRHALGKSGSVAAFLAHGIPVAAPLTHVNANEDPFFSLKLCQSIIIDPDISSCRDAIKAALASKEEIEISKIAETFFKDLCSCSCN
jgi:hypothetical protein